MAKQNPADFFGRRLTMAREEQGIAQYVLWQRMKDNGARISCSSIPRYESGDMIPSVSRVIEFATALKIPVEDLSGGVPKQELDAYFPQSKGTIEDRLINGDWHDKTIYEIAMELNVSAKAVSNSVYHLKKYHGIQIDYKPGKPNLMEGIPPCKRGTIAWELTHRDWSKLTEAGIAAALNKSEKSIHDSIAYLRREYGYTVKCVAYDGSNTGRVYVCGKCRKCNYFRSVGEYSYCDYNYQHFHIGREKHGPITPKVGGCDKFKPRTRGAKEELV